MKERPVDGTESIVRHEEQLRMRTIPKVTGTVRVRKSLGERPVDESIERVVERASVRRVPPNEGDSGEIERLPDGSISIPVLEEQLVVKKRTVVRERIVVTKQVTVRKQRVRGTVRRERVSIEREEEPHGIRQGDDPELPQEPGR
jgi:uncharacterized protein (TIGR02271 family)